mmetsp:Transcript_11657/g.36209  ORF Transcript_11657/g.36209 Transcript_11657/m.36209 type:complete len:227 (-) Transcript_11657:1569-2249(-)
MLRGGGVARGRDGFGELLRPAVPSRLIVHGARRGRLLLLRVLRGSGTLRCTALARRPVSHQVVVRGVGRSCCRRGRRAFDARRVFVVTLAVGREKHRCAHADERRPIGRSGPGVDVEVRGCHCQPLLECVTLVRHDGLEALAGGSVADDSADGVYVVHGAERLRLRAARHVAPLARHLVEQRCHVGLWHRLAYALEMSGDRSGGERERRGARVTTDAACFEPRHRP